MKPEHQMSPQQKRLYAVMSEISEECYCAGWMVGNEYAVWDALGVIEPVRYGMGEIDKRKLTECAALSLATDSWIIWRDDEDGPPADNSESWGAYAISIEEWKKRVAEHKTKPAPATTTESQITSGKAESTIDTPEFRELIKSLKHSIAYGRLHGIRRCEEALIAHIEAVCEKDREEAFEEGMKAPDSAYIQLEADRDHWKAKAEENEARLGAALSGQLAQAAQQAPDLYMANGKTTLLQYLSSAVPESEILDEWTKGYEECKRRLHRIIGPQLSPAQQEPAKAICESCGVDRAKAYCPKANSSPCEMVAIAASATDAITQPVKRPEDFRNMLDYANYISRLRPAIDNVIKRWESPLWRQEVGTNELIKELRAAANAEPPQATPEGGQDLPQLPGFVRKNIERAIEAAKRPQGMGVHDGMVRLHASHVERLLMVHDALAASQQAAEPVAWAAESMTGGAVRMLTKISLLESEVDRYVNRQDMAAIGCDRVKVPLYRAAPPQQADTAAIRKAVLIEQANVLERFFGPDNVLKVGFVADGLRVAAGEQPNNEESDYSVLSKLNY